MSLIDKVNKLKNDTKANLLSTKVLFKGSFIDVIEEEYLLPNNTLMKRERIIKNKNKKAVVIITITTDNKLVLVSQNRVNNKVTLEFPSGYIEKNENVIEASSRELLEETGYVSNDIKVLDNCYFQMGIDSSKVYIAIAKNAIKVKNQQLGKFEYIKYDEFSLNELKELIDKNYIKGIVNKLAFYELIYKLYI